MKRREFIQKSSIAAALPLMIGGFNIAKGSPIVDKFAKLAANNNRVLVLIQLQGGNDGLNTVIPLDQYDNLAKVRANIIVPKANALNLSDKTALNPAMTHLQKLFNNGKLGVVQSVGYPDPNYSHFRATDIWTSASDSNQDLSDGWLGRYLNNLYPDYPAKYPNTENPDPLSITIGGVVSNTCQGPIYNMGMAINNVTNFYGLDSGNPDTIPDTYAGKQITFLRDSIAKTQKYTTTIQSAVKVGKNLSTKYPAAKANPLADQLKIVAQLINGGLQTKVYVCNLGGFDTHSAQIQSTGSYLGTHAKLLGYISEAVDAFQDDLNLMKIEDRVVGMTFSEFGRRIISNESLGTDHGAAAPLFVFGTQVNPIIHGNSPTISPTANVNDNIPMQFDFRSVYGSILKQWLEVPDFIIKSEILFKDFPYLPIIKTSNDSVEDYLNNENVVINSIYPNPIYSNGKVKIKLINGWTDMSIFDSQGNKVTTIIDRNMNEGEYEFEINAGNLNSGSYFVKLQNQNIQKISGFNVVR